MIKERITQKNFKLIRTLLAVGIMFALTLLIIFIIDQSKERKIEKIEDYPQIESTLKGSEILIWSKGRKLGALYSSSAEMDFDTQVTTLDNIKDGVILDNKGEPALSLKADKGYYYGNTEDATMEGNVELKDIKEGTTLNTDKLEWKAKDEKVLVPGKLKITDKDYTLTGDSMKSDSKMENIEVEGNVEATIILSD